MVKKLLVLIVLAFAVVMAVPSLRAQFVATAITPVKNRVGVYLAPKSLKAMADQIDVRVSRAEGIPPAFESWLRRDFTGSETDPWGHTWYLKVGRTSYTVGSMGPDGVEGTGDDLIETRTIPKNVR